MELINDELRKKFEQYPLGSQDGKGFDAVCIAKYFVGNCTWLATEAEFDDENEEVLLYGYADLGLGPDCSEWGYFSLSELEDVTVPPYGLKVERDLYADGKTVRQLCDEIGLEYIDYMSQDTHTIYRANAFQVDDALMAIGNAIYELEDKIHPDLRDDIGVTDALNLLYDTYVKAVHYIRDCYYMDDYQKEMLMIKYNLEEAMEVLGGNDFDRE